MRRVLALARVAWLTSTSYRVQIVISFVGILVSVVPLYFVAGALQDLAAESISAESSQYFAFVVVGLIVYQFISTAVTTLPRHVGSGITTGTLEALLSTRSRLPTLMAGIATFPLLWTGVRSLVMLAGAWLLGATVVWAQVVPGLLVLALTVLAFIPFGVLAAASILAFRTAGPLAQGVLFLSAALGGVYYSTEVIPSWLQDVSTFIPLTYGLRALRRMILLGEPITAVTADLAILVGFVIVLTALSFAVFALAFRYSRRAGTLTQY